MTIWYIENPKTKISFIASKDIVACYMIIDYNSLKYFISHSYRGRVEVRLEDTLATTKLLI